MPGDRMTETEETALGYFSFRDLGLMFVLALLAVLAGLYGPQYPLPGGTIAGLVYNVLELPGPGAGVLIFGGIPCFFLILGMLLIKKPWTAVITSVFIIAIDLLMANQVSLHTLDVYLFIAIIIEIIALLPVEKSRWKYLVPGILALLSILVIVQMLTGQAVTGEDGAIAAAIPPGYVGIGLLGVLFAVVCYFYPLKYFIAGAIANLYFLFHDFLFWGSNGFATALPVLPALPVLVLAALTGGLVSATVAYGIDLVARRLIPRTAVERQNRRFS